MIFFLFALAVAGTAIYKGLEGGGGQFSRVTEFKNKYFPVEADILDHAARFQPFGFIRGRVLGRMEFKNPMPLVSVNEFRQSLNETEYGYAAPLGSIAINSQNYQKRIDLFFNKEETHPRLDTTRMDTTKGRFRRAQYHFIDDSA